MPHSLYVAAAEVEGALKEAARLTESLRKELDLMFSSVGSNQDMQALLEAASVAWDWAVLCKSRPSRRHTAAFDRVAQLLEPMLKHTRFPEGPAFATVPKRWPTDPGELRKQYLWLLGRVRGAFRAGEAKRTGGSDPVATCVGADVSDRSRFWKTIQAVHTIPLMVLPSVSAVLYQKLRQSFGSLHFPTAMALQLVCELVGSRISLFLGFETLN